MGKKFLVIRFSSIGDIVLTTPVVRSIKLDSSDNEVHFVTKKSFVELIDHNPNIDKVYSFEKSLSEIANELKLEKYDAVIDLHNNLRSRLITMFLNRPVSRFQKLNFKKWLLVQFKLKLMPSVHIVDRYLATLSSLHINPDASGLDFFIPDDVTLVSELNGKSYVAFVIGGTHLTKKLPVQKIINICNQVHIPFVLIGGKEEIADAREILKQTHGNVIDYCGQLSIQQSSRVIQYANAVISNDTGMMHIAAAFQKKIISVWGNTIPELGMYPYLNEEKNNIIVEVKNLSCRPCSKIGFSACPKNHFNCMNMISESDITKHLI